MLSSLLVSLNQFLEQYRNLFISELIFHQCYRIFMLEQFLRWTSSTSSSLLQMIMFLSSWKDQKWFQCFIRYQKICSIFLTHTSTQISCEPIYLVCFSMIIYLNMLYFTLLSFVILFYYKNTYYFSKDICFIV